MDLRYEALNPARWSDLEAVFGAKGCSIARQCWCMAYRRVGSCKPAAGQTIAQANRGTFKALVDAGQFTGLLAYRGDVPVGWLSFGPREDFKRLANSTIMKPVDEQPVWSVICFVVPAPQRRQGVARALLNAAIAHCRAHGVDLIEAYPVDRPEQQHPQDLWFGPRRMFDAVGFEEVACRKPGRPVLRLHPVDAGP